MLSDAQSSISCRIEGSLDIGTHSLFIGVVERVTNDERIDPLVWVDGCFANASRQSTKSTVA